MAKTKGKRGIKKSARLEKGKALRPVKPLKETIKLDYPALGIQYTR